LIFPNSLATSTIVDGSIKGSISKGTASLLSHSAWWIKIWELSSPNDEELLVGSDVDFLRLAVSCGLFDLFIDSAIFRL
jgi:hypothetical protein